MRREFLGNPENSRRMLTGECAVKFRESLKIHGACWMNDGI